jgi:hypothetical protein
MKTEYARPLTRARRPRHVCDFLRSWLAQLDVDFISRVGSGVVGVLRRSASCPSYPSVVGQSQVRRSELHILQSQVHR